jgi:hypothetical protein
VGFPIRKCPDQSLFAAPRTLSQRTTSFIASQRQGIHRIPLRHLIVLIDDDHPSPKERIASPERPVLQSAPGHHAVRHDGFSPIRRKPHGRSTPEPLGWGRPVRTRFLSTMTNSTRTRSVPRDKPGRKLFSEADELVRPGVQFRSDRALRDRGRSDHLVEPDGIEPTTSCLQSTRSPN